MISGSLSVKVLCKITGTSQRGYYALLKAVPICERKEVQERQDFDLILTPYKMHGYTKATKVIFMALLHSDPPIIKNLKNMSRLMEELNLSCPI